MTPLELYIWVAMSFHNVPCLWGGNNPFTGLDCSGFWLLASRSAGLKVADVDRTAQQIYEYVSIDPAWMEAHGPVRGATLFFGKDLHSIDHITIALDNQYMIGAEGCRPGMTREQAMRADARVKIRPIDDRRHLIAIYKPPLEGEIK